MSRVAALSANDSSQVAPMGHGWFAYLETALVSAIAAAIALWTSAGNLNSFQVSCIWLLAPVVCGLRRGSCHGLASGACSMALAAVWHSPAQHAWPVVANGAAIVLVGGVAGEISDWWRRRLHSVEAQARYHRLRLEEFSREYHSLRVSHEHLEQKLSAGGTSLRNALAQLNQSILSKPVSSREPLGGLGELISQLFAEHAPVHVAAVYAFSHADQFTLCAALGNPSPLTANNILMQRAFRTGQVASIPSLTGADVEGVIAVVPLTDVDGRTHAAVAIYDMPYAMFQPSTLSMLAVIGSHIGDLLRRNKYAYGSSDITKHFTTAVRICLEDYRRCGLSFALTIFSFEPGLVNGSLTAALMNGRGIDHAYACNDRTGRTAVLKLMPLADQPGAESFVRRVTSSLKIEPESLADLGVSYSIWSVAASTSKNEDLLQFCDRCGVSLLSTGSDLTDRQGQPKGGRAMVESEPTR